MSLVFYSWWNPPHAAVPIYLIIVGVIFSSFCSKKPGARIPFLVGSALLFMPLLYFKYSGFILNNFPTWKDSFSYDQYVTHDIPIGISFITFSIYSMMHDARSGKLKVADYTLTDVSAYVLVFPQLIAGPIIRAHELLPQIIFGKRKIYVTSGALLLFLVGIVKKLMIADPLGSFVDLKFSQVALLEPIDMLLATYGFSLQIYFDFSAYADMAIALGLFLGFQFPKNFDSPYTATSIVDFWRKWHITLSRWLRDYIYIPLGGSKGRKGSQPVNVMITMLLGGLWHGANWTFVVWGLLHGILISATHFLASCNKNLKFKLRHPRFYKFVLTFTTFNLVSLLWVFFRSSDLAAATEMIACIFTSPSTIIFMLCAAPIYLVFSKLHEQDNVAKITALGDRFRVLYLAPVVVTIFSLAIATGFTSSAKFIYFDF